MIQLEPCPSCRRHVKIDEAACPFCRSPLSDAFRATSPRSRPRARLGLRASFAFGLTLATGCGGKETTIADAGAPGPQDPPREAGMVMLPMTGEQPIPILNFDASIAPDPIDAAPFMPDEGIGVPIYKASPP